MTKKNSALLQRAAALVSLTLFSTCLVPSLNAQQPEESTTTGTVVSSSRNTMVIRAEDEVYRLFAFERTTVKPARILTGSRVRVTSVPSDEAGYRLATSVTVTEAATAAARTPTGTTTTQESPVVPPAVRELERDIERQVRRYRVGVRAGVGLDPEVIMVGAQAQFGPFFSPNVFFRPNVEFAFGEVTALFALNPEIIYRLPVSSRQGRWSAYAGIGPGFTFLHQNFERESGDGSRIDFGDFKSSTSLNILGGIQYRSGTFVELRASAYADEAPTLRLILGYNF